MASKQRILRLRRVNEQGNEVKNSFCLLSSSQISSNPLDLKILGTEGEEAFVTESKLALIFALAKFWFTWTGYLHYCLQRKSQHS